MPFRTEMIGRSLLAAIRRLVGGERRRAPRHDRAQVAVTNRLANAEIRLAKKLGTTPEELFDYRRADSILSRGRR